MKMKKVKFLLVLLMALLVLPFGVFADEAPSTDGENESKEVKVYFFHGNGCPHCEDAFAWFEEIEDEYGEYFEVVDYEVWQHKDNDKLKEAVAEARKETVNGVPYIVVGNQAWNGFPESAKEQILEKIKSEYEQDPADRYDVMNYVDMSKQDTTTRDIIITVVLLVVCGAGVAGILAARKSTN